MLFSKTIKVYKKGLQKKVFYYMMLTQVTKGMKMKRFDGKKLYLLRKNRGFSQRELGELLDCSHSLVNLMENGKCNRQQRSY